MASVSSLDQDMRNLRLSRYTPQAANEVRHWIEETLREPLPSGDLLQALRDGVALCKLINLVMPSPGVKYKSSNMPFIQMENISHFLKACEMPPLSLPAHDRFLTVDLYEGKDPAQVLQCLNAFSRQAHAANPNVVRTTIGPKKSSGFMTPTGTGGTATNGAAGWGLARSPSPTKSARAMSPALTGGSTGSQKTDTGPISSWSNRSDQASTAPAWNIHQYGYMGGASQGNQGISFGARRQITTQGPTVPSLAEKERARREKAAEEERRRQEAEEKREAEEQQAQEEEQRRWEEETRRAREEERRQVEEQKSAWAEQERRWKEDEVRRKQEEQEVQRARPEKPRVSSSTILRGQTLSQYQKEQASLAVKNPSAAQTPEQARVADLERQLEEARERERQYQAEREERLHRSGPTTAQTAQSESLSADNEREFLRQDWQQQQQPPASLDGAQRPLPEPEAAPQLPSRPLPEPANDEEPPSLPQRTQEKELPDLPQQPQQSDSTSSLPQHSSLSSLQASNPNSAPSSSPLGSTNRPLPTPDKQFSAYSPLSQRPAQSRTDRFLISNPAPATIPPRVSASQEAGDTSREQPSLRDTRLQSQQTTKAGGWAGKSLLEREMERERERQREWEANQESVKTAPRDASQGVNEGQSWDVNQYGFMGGDGMNRGSSAGSGIDFGGRRQILGPREMKR